MKNYLFILLLLLMAPAARAGNMVITLIDDFGNPVTNEKCILTFTSAPQSQNGGTAVQWRGAAWSGTNGVITLTNCSPGNWQVAPVDDNYATFTFQMPVTNGTAYAQNEGTADAGNTLPAGQVSYDTTTSDRRYDFNGAASSLQSNLVNGVIAPQVATNSQFSALAQNSVTASNTPDGTIPMNAVYYTVTNFSWPFYTNSPNIGGNEMESAILDPYGNGYISSRGGIWKFTNSTFTGTSISNMSPYTPVPYANHIGGIAYYNGYLYGGVETWNSANNFSNAAIAVWNSTNLTLVNFLTVTNWQPEITGVAVSPKGFIYSASYVNAAGGSWTSNLYVYALSGVTNISFVQAVPLQTPVYNPQGLSYYKGVIYIGGTGPGGCQGYLYGLDDQTYNQTLLASLPSVVTTTSVYEGPDLSQGIVVWPDSETETLTEWVISPITMINKNGVISRQTSNSGQSLYNDPALVVHWPMNEQSGWIVHDSSVNQIDGGITDQAGTTPAYVWTNSIFGYGLHVNNCGAVINNNFKYQNIGYIYPSGGGDGMGALVGGGISESSLSSISNKFTLGCWGMTDGMSDGTGLMGCSGMFFYTLYPGENELYVEFTDNAGTRFGMPLSSCPVKFNDGLPHYFSATWNGTVMNVYVDGINVCQTNHSAVSLAATGTAPLGVFQYGATSSSFVGTASDFSMWRRALSQGEILNIVDSKKGVSAVSLTTNGFSPAPAANQYLEWSGTGFEWGSPSGGSGSQTPILQNVNFSGYNISDGGTFAASSFVGSLSGNASTASSMAASGLTGTLLAAQFPALLGDVTTTAGSFSTAVAFVGGVSAANVASGATAANAATSADTASTIVERDASGNFSAGTITANGSALTSLNGSEIASGTVANTYLPTATTSAPGINQPDGTTIGISGGTESVIGSGLTGIPAASLTGIVPPANLPPIITNAPVDTAIINNFSVGIATAITYMPLDGGFVGSEVKTIEPMAPGIYREAIIAVSCATMFFTTNLTYGIWTNSSASTTGLAFSGITVTISGPAISTTTESVATNSFAIIIPPGTYGLFEPTNNSAFALANVYGSIRLLYTPQ